jgi:adenylate kinase family enzyme
VLAGKLARRLGLPLVHLDVEYWRPGWVAPPQDEWERRLRELCARDEWVLDGNFDASLDLRLERADTVVFLDLPTVTCVAAALGRWARWRGRMDRPDLPEGCPEGFDPGFLRWVLGYRRTERSAVLERLARFDGEVVVLTSRRAARRYAEAAK